jgi:prephenate dehydratase
MKVGIQGVRASFHDVAARLWCEGQEIQAVECPSFPKLAAALRDGDADLCMMAIENSIAGSILPNYSLLETHGFKIVGEVYLRIEHSLMALPGQKIGDLMTVQSHPMALLQCEDFLFAHPGLKAIEASDTAESAKEIADRKLKGAGAIAHKRAAQVYGLEVLAEGIESNKQNYTRFLAICRPTGAPSVKSVERANKASIRFEVAHRPGSLAEVLNILGSHSVNMTKIQSVPLPGRPYEYSLHVDLEWEDAPGAYDSYRHALAKVERSVSHLLHFGEYARGERPAL